MFTHQGANHHAQPLSAHGALIAMWARSVALITFGKFSLTPDPVQQRDPRALDYRESKPAYEPIIVMGQEIFMAPNNSLYPDPTTGVIPKECTPLFYYRLRCLGLSGSTSLTWKGIKCISVWDEHGINSPPHHRLSQWCPLSPNCSCARIRVCVQVCKFSRHFFFFFCRSQPLCGKWGAQRSGNFYKWSPGTVEQLEPCMKQEWDNIPPLKLQQLVSSLPRGLQTDVKKIGDATQWWMLNCSKFLEMCSCYQS